MNVHRKSETGDLCINSNLNFIGIATKGSRFSDFSPNSKFSEHSLPSFSQNIVLAMVKKWSDSMCAHLTSRTFFQ